MRSISRRLLPLAALAAAAAIATPALAQPYGYGDDGPPPFRHGPGWDGPPRWDRWHRHRRWRDEGFDRRDFRDGERREGRDRFRGGDEDRGRFRDDARRDDARRDGGDGGAPRRGGGVRNGPPLGANSD